MGSQKPGFFRDTALQRTETRKKPGFLVGSQKPGFFRDTALQRTETRKKPGFLDFDA